VPRAKEKYHKIEKGGVSRYQGKKEGMPMLIRSEKGLWPHSARVYKNCLTKKEFPKPHKGVLGNVYREEEVPRNHLSKEDLMYKGRRIWGTDSGCN